METCTRQYGIRGQAATVTRPEAMPVYEIEICGIQARVFDQYSRESGRETRITLAKNNGQKPIVLSVNEVKVTVKILENLIQYLDKIDRDDPSYLLPGGRVDEGHLADMLYDDMRLSI